MMFLLLSTLLLSTQDAAPDTRNAVPPRSAQKEAERAVKDLFKQEFRSKDPTQIKSLTKTLLDQARRKDDPLPIRYVLFREATSLAAKAGDFRTALTAVDGMAEVFKIDAIETKMTALKDCLRYAKTPIQAAGVARGYLMVAGQAQRDGLISAALEASKEAEKVSKRARDNGLLKRAVSKSKELLDLKRRYDRFVKAKAKLEKSPEDPKANLEVGLHLCFAAGNWDKGLPYLAKATKSPYGKMAQMEKFNLDTPDMKVRISNAWWFHAETERDSALKAACQVRAHHWLLAAAEGSKGISALKIQKRLREMETSMGSRASVDLLALIDPLRDAVEDEWSFEGSTLVTPTTRHGRLEIPFSPPDEYDVTIVVESKNMVGALIVGLTAKGKQFHVGVDLRDGWRSTYVGFLKEGEPVHRGKVFGDTSPKTIICSVRRTRVTVKVDGKVIIDWEADYDKLRPQQSWASPTKNALFLGVHTGAYRITEYLVTPMSGPGVRLR